MLESGDFRQFLASRGDVSFTEDLGWMLGRHVGAIFLSGVPLECEPVSGERIDVPGVPVGCARSRPGQNSHVIRLDQVSIKPRNVAIPMI